MKSAREMLPQGCWPREERGNAPAAHSTTRRPAPDPGRFAFLLSVGQIIQRLRVESLGAGYEAFVFRAPSGRRLALVESPRSINALYVFNADDPSWQSVASRTRYEVTTTRPPQFVRKLYHTSSFQERVAKLLAEA